MPSDGRIGLPPSIDELITRHVEAVMGELKRRYSRSLERNVPGTAVMAKVVRKATVSGFMAQLELSNQLVGTLPHAGEGTWDAWQRRREQTLEGDVWPEHLARAAPSVVEAAGASVAAAGREVALRERRPGEARRIGEQAAEAGGALVRCLCAS